MWMASAIEREMRGTALTTAAGASPFFIMFRVPRPCVKWTTIRHARALQRENAKN